MNRSLTALQNGEARSLLSEEIAHVFSSSDFNIANLECPLIDAPSPVSKCGPTLDAPVSCAVGLRSLPVHVAGLANNHIMDHGRQGLESTLRACKESGIVCCGAGMNRKTAAEPYIKELRGLRVAIWAAVDYDPSTTMDDSPCANPIDEIEMYRYLSKRRCWDALIVLLHAGNHLNPWPSPRLQRLSRFLIELGTTVVVCQHSHCAGAVERYGDGVIIYGQGNFIFDWDPIPGGAWNNGFMAQIDLSRDGIRAFEAIPYVQFAQEPRVDLLSGPARNLFFESQLDMSKKVSNEDWIRSQWEKYARQVEKDYYNLLLGLPFSGRIMRRLTDELGIPWRPFTRKHKRLLGNLFRCEEHREVLKTILIDKEEQ